MWKKWRRPTSFITDCRAFPKLIFLRCYSCWRSRTPPSHTPPYSHRYFYVMAARWISSKGCKSNNQNVRTFLRWNTATVLWAGFSYDENAILLAKIATMASISWEKNKTKKKKKERVMYVVSKYMNILFSTFDGIARYPTMSASE